MAKISSVIGGKYEILKKIGQGGMSEVYLAMDQRLNKQWAVKEIKKVANSKTKDVIIQSLIAEANMMKKLDHTSLPRIVDIIDTGKTIYVVMDYIEGEPLDRILNERGAQPQETVIEWAKVLCDVLHYLHSQNPPIIYRDMKPANIMLKPEGNLKVIDFGIAREYKVDNIADTVSLGTRGYAAPEQFGGQGQTDARTDIYSLGVTLYHLVTGQNPCEPPYEMYPIRQWNPRLSGGFEAIIQKCTQLNPADRYQSCAELKYALDHYEEADGGFQKKQRKKLAVFTLCVIFCLLTAAGGITSVFLAKNEVEADYSFKIGISQSSDHESKVNSYIDAIRLKPERTEAYELLLDSYVYDEYGNEKEMDFSIDDSNSFMAIYNENKMNLERTDISYWNLQYKIGFTYLYYYSGSGGSENFRERIQKAADFFRDIKENGTGYNLEYYKIAESYTTLGSFCSYMLDVMSYPTHEECVELMNALDVCIDNASEYNDKNADYVKFTVYNKLVDYIYNFRNEMAAGEIPIEQLLGLVDKIYADLDAVKQTNLRGNMREKYDEMIKERVNITEGIKTTYTNSQK